MHSTAIIPHHTVNTVDTNADHLAAQARAILAKRRKQTMSVDQETRMCAVIATLPRGVKVQDIAPMFGLTPSTLSRLRGLAFRGATAFPDTLRPALQRSFVPRIAAVEETA